MREQRVLTIVLQTRPPVLTACGARYLTAEVMGHPLQAVADSENRDIEVVERRIRSAGVLVGTLTASYVVPLVALGTVTRWAPEESDPAAGEVGPQPEALSIAVDASMVLSTTLSVALFVSLGAAVAALPRLLERAPIETTAA